MSEPGTPRTHPAGPVHMMARRFFQTLCGIDLGHMHVLYNSYGRLRPNGQPATDCAKCCAAMLDHQAVAVEAILAAVCIECRQPGKEMKDPASYDPNVWATVGKANLCKECHDKLSVR